jgi:hypothetical protein
MKTRAMESQVSKDVHSFTLTIVINKGGTAMRGKSRA